jgi:3-methylcrotonyl-CoA carboxylase alpha subunit
MNAAARRDVHLTDQFGRAFVVEMRDEPAVDYWPGEPVTSIDEGGERFLVQLERAAGGAGGAASDGAIIAPMPGKVISVDVAAGEVVAKGQKLMVLEAMKMEHALTAPFDGVVEELNAVAGAQVQVEALLAQIKKVEG